jgi:tRNA-Thr(GGU) m(6)t(6)A37 methyltransferase TsaA
MEIEPIGRIKKISDNESILEVEPAYEEGLSGIDPGDRLTVLYWMHKLDNEDRRLLKVHPKGDPCKPLTGVFKLRSPMRPNPIGVTTVRVKSMEGNRLTVEGLDALEGSPIIDIKAG